MMSRIKHIYLLMAAVSALLVSCRIARPYKPPAAPVTGLFRGTSSDDTATLASLPYTQIFTDTILQQLIAEGISNNLNLQIAYTRILQAEAYLRQSKLAFLPSVNPNVSAALSKLADVQGGKGTGTIPQVQAGFTTGWEADLWGRLASSRRANLAALLESEAYSRVVQTGLVASIASYYYQLLSLDKQLTITNQTIALRQSTLETIKALKEGAVVTGAAVVQSEANLYAAQVTIPDLKQDIRETENALSILLARPPAPIIRDSLEDQQPVTLLQTGVPAQLLQNRPDVQQAAYAFNSAFELTNVAYASFYPSFTITGSGGLLTAGLTRFFSTGALFGNVAAGLTQPLFNRGLNRTQLAVARANQQAALLAFQNTLLVAGQEVSDALYLHQTALEKRDIRVYQLTALEKSVEYTQELLNNGFANYTEVLTAQQSLLSAELGSVNDRLQQLQAIVNLYRALGGGWR